MPLNFRVWAPQASSVNLVALGREHPMKADDNHWWSVDLDTGDAAAGDPATGDPATGGPGTGGTETGGTETGGTGTGAATDDLPEIDYGFRLDSADKVLPDPRSRRQPQGVHELSRTFDPGGHRWNDAGWTGRRLAGSLIYEMHVGTFTTEGTLDAAIGKLDHLTSIGITMVELLPVNAFNGTHNWGYDGVLWFAVHEAYGGPRAYQRFVDACHQRGIAVIQDVVYNHLGASGNYLPMFGPYLHDDGRSSTWGASVNLDGPLSGEVRRYILDNVVMWLRDYHVDGLRLDAVHALSDNHAIHLLEDIAIEVDALAPHVRRPLTLIAESDLNDPKMITPREAGGYGLTAQWNDDFHHVLHVALTGETDGYYADFGSMSAIAKVIGQAFFHDGTYSSFRGRDHGRPVDTLVTPSWRFIGYSQDHDQVGNRAAGDRLSSQLSAADLAIAAVLVLTGPFTPMLFMGEEWAASTPWAFFTSHPEPELADATREGRIREFERMGWDRDAIADPQDENTFLSAKLDWTEVNSGRHAEMLDLYRRLAGLRRDRAELTDPRFTRTSVTFDDDQRWLVADRSGLRILANLSEDARSIELDGTPGPVLLATQPGVLVKSESVTLPPHTAAVLAPLGD